MVNGDLEELVAVAREQLRWTKASGIGEVRHTLIEVLDRNELRLAYEAMDGQRTQQDIATESGVSTGSVSNYGRAWRALGLVFENEAGRLEHLVSLPDLGVSLDV